MLQGSEKDRKIAGKMTSRPGYYFGTLQMPLQLTENDGKFRVIIHYLTEVSKQGNTESRHSYCLIASFPQVSRSLV